MKAFGTGTDFDRPGSRGGTRWEIGVGGSSLTPGAGGAYTSGDYPI